MGPKTWRAPGPGCRSSAARCRLLDRVGSYKLLKVGRGPRLFSRPVPPRGPVRQGPGHSRPLQSQRSKHNSGIHPCSDVCSIRFGEMLKRVKLLGSKQGLRTQYALGKYEEFVGKSFRTGEPGACTNEPYHRLSSHMGRRIWVTVMTRGAKGRRGYTDTGARAWQRLCFHESNCAL